MLGGPIMVRRLLNVAPDSLGRKRLKRARVWCWTGWSLDGLGFGGRCDYSAIPSLTNGHQAVDQQEPRVAAVFCMPMFSLQLLQPFLGFF